MHASCAILCRSRSRVCWTPFGLEVTDHRDVVRGHVPGQTDRFDRIVAGFRRLPQRRLAVLGPPRSDKGWTGG